jgi:hypothetical protein
MKSTMRASGDSHSHVMVDTIKLWDHRPRQARASNVSEHSPPACTEAGTLHRAPQWLTFSCSIIRRRAGVWPHVWRGLLDGLLAPDPALRLTAVCVSCVLGWGPKGRPITATTRAGREPPTLKRCSRGGPVPPTTVPTPCSHSGAASGSSAAARSLCPPAGLTRR